MGSIYEERKKIFDWVEFEDGRAKFDGGVRGCDEAGHETFAVQIPDRQVYYGEFTICFEPDKTHYNVEVVRFGYVDRNNVDNPHPDARAMFTLSEEVILKRIITELMLSWAVKKPSPLFFPDNFLGKVYFREGWLKLRA